MDKKTVFLAVITGLGLVLWLQIGPLLDNKLGTAPAPQKLPETTEEVTSAETAEKNGEVKSLDNPQ